MKCLGEGVCCSSLLSLSRLERKRWSVSWGCLLFFTSIFESFREEEMKCLGEGVCCSSLLSLSRLEMKRWSVSWGCLLFFTSIFESFRDEEMKCLGEGVCCSSLLSLSRLERKRWSVSVRVFVVLHFYLWVVSRWRDEVSRWGCLLFFTSGFESFRDEEMKCLGEGVCCSSLLSLSWIRGFEEKNGLRSAPSCLLL